MVFERQLETSWLGHGCRHYCTPLASFDFRTAFCDGLIVATLQEQTRLGNVHAFHGKSAALLAERAFDAVEVLGARR